MAGTGFSHEPKSVPLVSSKFRKIVTKIPVPESIPLLEKLYETESLAMHGQLPIIWDRAENFQVFDAWGNCWLDFSSTIFVTNAGHANPRIVRALRDQLDKPLLHTYTFATRERIEYLDYLISNTPEQFEKAFLLSAGTEATECALKLMRINGQKIGKRRGGIICFEGNWHGRTLGAQLMGGNQKQKTWIGFEDKDIHHLPFPYPWNAEAAGNPVKFFEDSLALLEENTGIDLKRDISGIMIETFQGWGAVFYPPSYIQAVTDFARENKILIAFDEMQSGFGRTGELFGYMHYGVEPDLLCCGKGAASSLPLALVLGRKEIMDLPEIGSMSSTHSANPMVCAAGKANLQALIEDGLITNARDLGVMFHDRLSLIQIRFSEHLSSIQGKGLVAALIFATEDGTVLPHLCDKIAETLMHRGVIVVHTGRESIKLAPPLSISSEALQEGLDVIEQTIADCIELI